jgi:hypothetical protein
MKQNLGHAGKLPQPVRLLGMLLIEAQLLAEFQAC